MSLPSGLQFLVVGVVMILLYLTYAAHKYDGAKGLIAWFKSKKGKGALGGIGKAIAAAVVFVLVGATLSGCAGTWNNGVSGFVGLERTKKISPQCRDEGPDTKTTSNLGLTYHAWKSKDELTEVNAQYTHHSCAFSPDRLPYDAAGFSIRRYIWLPKR